MACQGSLPERPALQNQKQLGPAIERFASKRPLRMRLVNSSVKSSQNGDFRLAAQNQKRSPSQFAAARRDGIALVKTVKEGSFGLANLPLSVDGHLHARKSAATTQTSPLGKPADHLTQLTDQDQSLSLDSTTRRRTRRRRSSTNDCRLGTL